MEWETIAANVYPKWVMRSIKNDDLHAAWVDDRMLLFRGRSYTYRVTPAVEDQGHWMVGRMERQLRRSPRQKSSPVMLVSATVAVTVVLMLVVVAATSCAADRSGNPVESARGGAEGLLPELGQIAPDRQEQTSISEIARTYRLNPLAWDATYKGRKLEITGVVLSLDKVDEAALKALGVKAEFYGYVGLKEDDNKALRTPMIQLTPEGTVFCTFNKGNWEEFAQLRRGHIVSMVGVGQGQARGLGIALRDCSIVRIIGTY